MHVKALKQINAIPQRIASYSNTHSLPQCTSTAGNPYKNMFKCTKSSLFLTYTYTHQFLTQKPLSFCPSVDFTTSTSTTTTATPLETPNSQQQAGQSVSTPQPGSEY